MFTTYVWSSVCGWNVVLIFKLVSMGPHNIDQNYLKNQESRSEIIDVGNPKCSHTFWKNICVVCSAITCFFFFSEFGYSYIDTKIWLQRRWGLESSSPREDMLTKYCLKNWPEDMDNDLLWDLIYLETVTENQERLFGTNKKLSTAQPLHDRKLIHKQIEPRQ